MKRLALAIAILAAAGCASPQLSKEPAWDKAPAGQAAADAKAGKYHYGLERMMDVAQYMFETEGFLFTRRDDDTKSFRTAPFKLDKKGDDHFVVLSLTAEGELTTADWKHMQIVDYKDVDACKDDAACQAKFSEDWNWRLFKHLP